MATGHLADSEISGYLDDALSPAERRQVELHIEGCAECRHTLIEAMRALTSWNEGTSARAGSTSSGAPPVIRRRHLWAIGLTSALAAGIAAIFVVHGSRARTLIPVQRSVGGAATSEGRATIGVVVPSDGAEVGAGALFTWRNSGDDVYRFTILDPTGAPLWSAEVTDTSVALPAAVRLERGKRYFWRVDGITNGIRATTGARRFVGRD